VLSGSGQPSPVTFWSLERVKAAIRELESKFLDLNTDAEEEICEKEAQDKRFLRKFRKFLQLLPVAKKAPHVKFFRECEHELLVAENAAAILAILCRYIDFRKYEVFFEVVVKFCSDPLQGSMKEYCQVLERFERATTVNIYTNAISAGKQLKVAFSRMVLKINKSEFECTLYEIRKLKEEIAEASSLESHSVYIESASVQCVKVVMRFPPSVVGWVLASFTPELMSRHHVTEVVLDGEPLTGVQTEREELNKQLISASDAGEVVQVTSLLNSGADIETVGWQNVIPHHILSTSHPTSPASSAVFLKPAIRCHSLESGEGKSYHCSA
jgi:hypothetical protein